MQDTPYNLDGLLSKCEWMYSLSAVDTNVMFAGKMNKRVGMLILKHGSGGTAGGADKVERMAIGFKHEKGGPSYLICPIDSKRRTHTLGRPGQSLIVIASVEDRLPAFPGRLSALLLSLSIQPCLAVLCSGFWVFCFLLLCSSRHSNHHLRSCLSHSTPLVYLDPTIIHPSASPPSTPHISFLSSQLSS
jgi:hypothetical protein